MSEQDSGPHEVPIAPFPSVIGPRPLEALAVIAALVGNTPFSMVITGAEYELIERARADRAIRDCGEAHSEWEMAVWRLVGHRRQLEIDIRVLDDVPVEPKGHG